MVSHPARRVSPRTRNVLRSAVESLESRKYLTTLQGGDSFLFADDQDNVVRVDVEGDATVELVGAIFTDNEGFDSNSAVLGNIPGIRIRGNQRTPLFGGFRPEVTLTDPDDPNGEGDDAQVLAALYGVYVNTTSNNSEVRFTVVDFDEEEFTIESQPFDGGRDIVLSDDNTVSLGDGTGDLLLGIENEDGGPVLQVFDADEVTLPFGLSDLDLPAGVEFPANAGPQFLVDGNIGQILFAGTITGSIFINGNVDRFYAGNIITGDFTGGFSGSTPAGNDNFAVNGDIGQLAIKGYLGFGISSDDTFTFLPNTELAVSGSVGSIIVGEDSRAAIDVVGDISNPVDTSQLEWEELTTNDDQIDDRFDVGIIADDTFFNDTMATAQPLFTGFSQDTQRGNTGILRGSVFRRPTGASDDIDYFSVGLLAGQSMTVELITTDLIPVNVGIFDPDGRLIASDQDNTGIDRNNTRFRFTADRPGTYYIAAAEANDLNFNGARDDAAVVFGQAPYQLTVITSETTFGGMNVRGDMYVDPATQNSSTVRVRRGDMGSIYAGGDIRANGEIQVSRGSLRALEGDQLGFSDTNGAVEFIEVLVPRGSVGLLRSRSVGGAGGDGTGGMFLNFGGVGSTGAAITDRSVGGDIQVVESLGNLVGNIISNQAIGTVRARTMTDNRFLMPIISANADRSGQDGIIDLVDVVGDMGTVQLGGPGFDAGPGGNVRYVRAGGQAFRDFLFGGGLPEDTTFAVGTTNSFTDDSGTLVTISPQRTVTGSTVNAGTVTVTTLPARNGGVVVLDVTSDVGLSLSAGGGGDNAGVEIGTINITGTGAPVVYNTSFRRFTQDRTVAAFDLRFTGSRSIDVFELNGNNFTSISNPRGEFVNANISDVGTLVANQIGFASRSTASVVDGFEVITQGNAFPFVSQRSGFVLGDAIEIQAQNGLGNIISTGGSFGVGLITANADGKFTSGLGEGVEAPIYINGNLNTLRIGEGIAASGTGIAQRSGVYVTGTLLELTNSGSGTDIRGDVVAGNISSISLNGGSIIDADIAGGVIPARFESASEVSQFLFTINSQAGIDNINITNGGGIIGSFFTGGNIGTIRVSGGYGMLNSIITVLGANTIDNVSVDGLGIRNCLISGGANTNVVQASGDGSILDVSKFSRSVLTGARSGFDLFSGVSINAANDLYFTLGIGPRNSKQSNITNSGIIRDTTINGSRRLGKVSAYQIDTAFPDADTTDPLYPMRISFGNEVNNITTGGPIFGLQVTTGALKTLSVGTSIAVATITASGTIGKVNVGSNVRGTTTLSAEGPDGMIQSLNVGRNLFGEIVSRRFGTIRVGRDVGTGRLRSFGSIDLLDVGGNILSGAYIRASGPIKKLVIDGDLQEGSTVRATSFSNQLISGVIDGDLVVG